MSIESARLITGVSWFIVFAAVVAAYAVGHWLGRRRHTSGREAVALDTVQGSLLALLGLLLAFSFSSAAGRFVDRQDLILQEANAIGTARRTCGQICFRRRMRTSCARRSRPTPRSAWPTSTSG